MSDIRKYVELIESCERLDESFKVAKDKFIEVSGNEQEVKEYLDKFKELSKRNIIKGQDKDISKWIKAGWDDFKSLVDMASESTSNREKKKKIKSDSITVYEDGEKMVVIPLTEKASCYYGKKTQWCTAATTSNNMFSHYVMIQRNIPFYIIIRNGEKYACMYNRYKDKFDCYDELDNSISFDNFRNKIGITRNDIIRWYNEYKDILDSALSLKNQDHKTVVAAIRATPQAISELDNPSDDLIEIIVDRSPEYLSLVDNPPEHLIVDAIIKKPDLTYKFANLSTTAIEKLLMRNPNIYLDLDVFNNATEQMKVDAEHIGLVERSHVAIKKIPDASEIVLWYAIGKNPMVVKHIHNFKNFNYDMYTSVVNTDPTLIKYGKPDDELLALAAYREPMVLMYFDNINEEVLEFIVGEHKDAYKYIKNPPDHITELQFQTWGEINTR